MTKEGVLTDGERKRLMTFALRLTHGDYAKSEDLVAETQMRAFLARDRIRDQARPTNYLMRILQRRFIDDVRESKRIQRVDFEHCLEVPNPESEPPAMPPFGITEDELSRAITMLPKKAQEALEAIKTMDQKEAAASLGIHCETLRTRLFRAREVIFDHIDWVRKNP